MLSFGEELMSMDVISFAEINNRAAVSSELDQTERRARPMCRINVFYALGIMNPCSQTAGQIKSVMLILFYIILNAKKFKIKRFKQPQSVASLPPFGCLNRLILTS